MLNFIYYPVSFILWVWHQVFGFLLGPENGIGWALSVVFLVFTLRAVLFKPFVSQVRSMRKMQEFAPEIAKLKKKYANDRQKQATEMQRLQKEHGVNPIAGCLPVLVQVPVFIGLFQVLRNFSYFNPDGSERTENYFFDQEGVRSFLAADFFGAKLGNWPQQEWDNPGTLEAAGTSMTQMLVVMIPLMIMAGVFTHITARHSVARQTAAQGENPQTAIMNKLMLYVFPIGVVVGAPFLPLAVLLYWVANNLWTLGQQWLVYRRIEVEETAKREEIAVNQKARAPRPGQKPVRPEVTVDEPPAKTPGAKPVTRKTKQTASSNGSTNNGAASKNNGAATNGASVNGSASNGSAGNGAAANGSASTGSTTNGSADDAAPNAAAPQDAGASTSTTGGSGKNRSSAGAAARRGGAKQSTRRPRKRR